MAMTVLFMVSCNTDDSVDCPDDLTGALSDTESEFAGAWIFSGMMAEDALDLSDDKTDNPSKDIFAQYSECDRDLVYNFMTDRNYTLKQGYEAEECNNKQSLAGTWSLTSGELLTFVASCATQSTKIDISDSGDSFSYSVNLNFQDVNGAQKTTKVKFTYSKVIEDKTPL